MKSNAAKKGHFVLENRAGQVIRAFQIEAPEFAVIYNEDTGRVETCADVAALEEAGVEFSVLAETSQADLKKQPLAIASSGTLKYVDNIECVTPRHELDEEKDRFIVVLKKTAALNVALLLFSVTVNWLFPTTPETEEPVVVTIDLPQPEVKKPETQKTRKTVEVSERKIERKQFKKPVKVVQRQVVKQVKPTYTQQTRQKSFGTNRNSAKVATGGKNINQVGALAALGKVSNAPNTGGTLDIKNIQTRLGSGGGGTGRAGNGGLGRSGTGGFSNALGGVGLASASRGTGGGVGMPSGGYGTRGKAGGQNGYGRVNLSGGSDGYFQPLDQDAEVEGGLDKDQINEVIQKNMGQILYCYEQGLQVKPSLSGRVGVRFMINGAGRVSTAGVAHSSMRSGQVEGCIVSKLKAFRFPQPVGGVNVKVMYPFQFQRVSQR